MDQIKLWLLCVAVVLQALPHPVSAAPPKTGEENVVLTVAQGDTLLDICGRLVEKRNNCRKLARINGLKNPDRLYAGQTLAIPIRFLKGIPMDGVVTFIKGDARIQEKGGEWAVLSLHDHVREGSGVTTGAESAVEITFEDGSSLFQNADTALELSSSRTGPLHLLRELVLMGGRTVTKVKRATGRSQRFIIHTPAASAAVRGTEFRVSSDAGATTRSEVMHGLVGIAAAGGDVAVRENEGTMVKEGLPPIAPRQLLPPPQVLLRPPFNTLPLEFRFTRIPGATAYRALVTRDREGKDIVKEEVIDPGAPLVIREMEDGAYHVRAMSIDDVGLTGIQSEPAPVRIRVNPLPPLLRSPAAGAELRSHTVKFDWLRVRDAAGYRLQIATDEEFTEMAAETELKDVELTSKPLESGTYFYRVRSIAVDGYEGGWSPVQTFALVPPPPVPSLEAPTQDDKEVRIRWRDLGAGYTYRCQMAHDEGFRTMVIDRTLTAPEIRFEKPGPGTYFVRTSAIDDKGYEGAFSPPQTLEIRSRFPYWGLGLLVPVGVVLMLAL